MTHLITSSILPGVTRRTPFTELLKRRWIDGDTMLCVGLDPDPSRLPASLRDRDQALFDFCARIVDATADLVCAFKPQIAYFAARGAEDQLARLIGYVHQRHPQVPVILDAKRGDIGDTARFYAEEVFERFDADAVTVNPYLGPESIQPYLDYADRGVFLLCRTSNADSDWLQGYPGEHPAFLRVAEAAGDWNGHGNLMLVAGATYPEDLRRIRTVVGDMPLLVPGIGAQGGDLAAVFDAGLDRHGHGLIINTSRTVLYAGAGHSGAGTEADSEAGAEARLAEAARAAASELRDRMRRLRDQRPGERASSAIG